MLSHFLRSALTEHAIGGAPYVPPASYWVKLHLDDAGLDGLLAPAVEIRRREVIWAGQVDGLATAAFALEWVGCPADEGFTWATLWDADDPGGNCLAVDPLLVPKTVAAGDIMRLTSVTFRLV